MQQRCRNRQETVNKWLKQFGVLKLSYRRDLRMHAEVLRACAVLTQLDIDDGDKLVACGYNDHYNNSRGEKQRCSFSGEESDVKVMTVPACNVFLKTIVVSSYAG